MSQKLKESDNAPVDLINKKIYFLDVDGLFSNPDQLEQSFNELMEVLTNTNSKDTILVIEDTRDFIEAVENSGHKPFINRIVRALEDGCFQVILETKDNDINMVLDVHSHMRQNFTVIDVKPPQNDTLVDIVTTACEKLETHHNVEITSEAISMAIDLTTSYPGKERSLDRAQPEASLVLLDRACTSYVNSYYSDNENNATWQDTKNKIIEKSNEQKQLEQELLDCEKEIDRIESKMTEEQIKNRMFGQEYSEYSSYREKVKKKLPIVSQEVQELINSAHSNMTLLDTHITNEFSTLTGIDADKLNEDTSAKLLSLPSSINKNIIGQEHVVDRLSNEILISRTPGLKADNKPDAAFLFCGPSGVGKTEIAKQLALHFFEDKNAMVRFDMSNYSKDHTVSNLIGSPRGYAGYEEGGDLTKAVRKDPNAIVLLDEIEKGHKNIFDIFLQVLDDARLQDNNGTVVSFEHTIVLFTTNIGSEHLLNDSLSYEEQMELVIADLEKEYRPEFLNRFAGRENIVGFKALPLEVIQMIARSQIKNINDRMKAKGQDINVFMSEEKLVEMCTDKYDPKRGARAIDGIFRNSIQAPLATMIHKNEVETNNFEITYEDGKLGIKPA